VFILLSALSLYPQTTYTTSFALYHLAVNPEAQKKLYEESCQLLVHPSCAVTASILAKAQYTKAVLKETFRMNPISVGIGRILAQDTIFSGYHVPKGVSVHVFGQGFRC
jgi:ecdysteroid 25-hydroxylase CYP302A1